VGVESFGKRKRENCRFSEAEEGKGLEEWGHLTKKGRSEGEGRRTYQTTHHDICADKGNILLVPLERSLAGRASRGSTTAKEGIRHFRGGEGRHLQDSERKKKTNMSWTTSWRKKKAH